jgi:hypothetical protein
MTTEEVPSRIRRILSKETAKLVARRAAFAKIMA